MAKVIPNVKEKLCEVLKPTTEAKLLTKTKMLFSKMF